MCVCVLKTTVYVKSHKKYTRVKIRAIHRSGYIRECVVASNTIQSDYYKTVTSEIIIFERCYRSGKNELFVST